MDKIIGVRLPSDHPIFKLPSGQRSEKVREALDIDAKLDKLMNMLVSIENRLSRLEGMINSGAAVKQEAKGDEIPASFDIEAFADF